jgi:hypothetical protein
MSPAQVRATPSPARNGKTSTACARLTAMPAGSGVVSQPTGSRSPPKMISPSLATDRYDGNVQAEQRAHRSAPGAGREHEGPGDDLTVRGAGDVAAGRARRERAHLVLREDPRALPLGQRGEGARGAARVGLRAQRRVHGAEQVRGESRLQAAHLTGREQLDPVTAPAQHLDAAVLELVLLGRVDRLHGTRLPELDVLAVIELHGLEDLDAARREVRLQIGTIAPADGIDRARVHAGGAGGDLAPFE